MPLFAPPMAGPATLNLISITFAKEVTSSLLRPFRIRVPPPAAPPLRELITIQPSASVSESCHSKMTSGFFCLYFSSNSLIGSFFDKKVL